jgi:hypothetical protein
MKIVYHPVAEDEFLDAVHCGFWLSTITAVTRVVGSTGSANDVRHYLVVARSWAPTGPPPSTAKSCAGGGSGAQLRCAALRPTRPCHGDGPSGRARFGGYTGDEPPYVDTSASETCRGPEKTRRPEGAGLCRVAGNRAAGAVEEDLWLCLIEGRRGEGLQCEGLLEAFSLGSYLLLVDGTSRLCRQGKANRQHSRLDGLRPDPTPRGPKRFRHNPFKSGILGTRCLENSIIRTDPVRTGLLARDWGGRPVDRR